MLGLDDLKQQKGMPEPTEEATVEDAKLEPTPGIDVSELDLLAIGRAVGLDTLDRVKKNSTRLEHLMSWARSQGANDQLGLVAEIRSLIHRLGSPSIHDLYVYTRLDTERTEAINKMRKMEKPL